jgi:selenocysteine lyase/cysteine desulfurase
MSLWHTLRSCFPVTDAAIHLDHARAAALPSRVDEAVREFVDAAARDGGRGREQAVAREVERVRARVGMLLGAAPQEVAFVTDALRGLEAVMGDVAWRRGDVVVKVGQGVSLPEASLASRGVELLRVPLSRGVFSLGPVEEALRHPRARLLALASVQAHSGARAPLTALAELCAERGVLLCVDASHHAGSLPVHLQRDAIDYLVADAHRFLLALAGTGVLLRNRRIAVGARTAAQSFERGVQGALGIVALGAAVDLLLELTPAAIEKRVLELTDRLVEGLADRGIDPLVPRSAARSAIVSFRAGDEPPAATALRLDARSIRVSELPDGVRVSPHAYNTPAEIDALLKAL